MAGWDDGALSRMSQGFAAQQAAEHQGKPDAHPTIRETLGLPPAEAWPDYLYACREMPTRHCPVSYNSVCGDRPCARFGSSDETPWARDIALNLVAVHARGCLCPRCGS